MQARAAAASATRAHVHVAQQRHQLLQWRAAAAHGRSVWTALLNAQCRRAQRSLEVTFRSWRTHLHASRGKTARRAAAIAWACRCKIGTVMATWAAAAKQLMAERDAALQTLLQRRALRAASAVFLMWRLGAHHTAEARSAAIARLSTRLERCRLHTCLAGWAKHTAAVRRMTALLEGHAGRRRRRQLLGSLLAWSDAAREAAEGRDVLAGCLAYNSADRQRAAVLEAWQGAARRSVYVRKTVAQSRHGSPNTTAAVRPMLPERGCC